MHNLFQSLSSVPFIRIIFFMSLYTSTAYNKATKYDIEGAVIQKTIIVDLVGKGDFTSVQKAVDSVPENNKSWIHIHLKCGTYFENVTIPESKQFIVLSGEDSRTTTIESNQAGPIDQSATFTVRADNFMAKNISFKNGYNLASNIQKLIKGGNYQHRANWAAAIRIFSDKVSFYGCGFMSIQDTLSDLYGRHYFENCYVEGAIDFIWGFGQSTYLNCVINVRGDFLNLSGFITAQGRQGPNDPNGFVFVNGNITGTGTTYLGRAYGPYSRVIFSDIYMTNIIVPEGWNSWNSQGHENTTTYVESNCKGPGSNSSSRVKWMKTMNTTELMSFTIVDNFINKDGWIQRQPSLL